jgi:hypothetical protein
MHSTLYEALLSATLCVLSVLVFAHTMSSLAVIRPGPLAPVPLTVKGYGPENHPRE